MSSMGQRYALLQCGQEQVLAPAVGLQRPQQGSRAGFQVVDGAGSGKAPGGGDHSDGEIVVRETQLHRTLKERGDGWVELSGGPKPW